MRATLDFAYLSGVGLSAVSAALGRGFLILVAALRLGVVSLGLLLTACGGGSDTAGANAAFSQDTDSGYRLDVALFDISSGAPTTTVAATSPAQIVVSVSRFGRPVPSQRVDISSDLGVVGVSNGSLLTDAAGQARVHLLAGAVDGAGTVTASIDIGASRLLANLNFFSAGTAAAEPETLSLRLALQSEAGVSNTLRADDPGILSLVVSNQNGIPQSNVLIRVRGNIVSFNPPSGTVLTDDAGLASIQVLAGDSAGIATVVASIGAALAEGEGQAGAEDEAVASETLNVVVAPPAIQLGGGFGDDFREGQLSAATAAVSAGGTVSVSATLVNRENAAFTRPVSVQFFSPCVEQGLATLDREVTTVEGVATATYRAVGCVGSDTVSAVLDFGGSQYTASIELSVSADSAGSIVFQDAKPSTIVFRGAGGQGLRETATLRFQVLGEQGLPVANRRVDFTLTTEVGGIVLSPVSALSDAAGYVSTSVQSGSVATSVVVIAAISDSPNIATQSASLVISTGAPDQDSVSLSLSQCNPEAWSDDGQEVTVTVRAADFFNNLVPDGVGFAFSSEGGSIEPSCVSVGGGCSVRWIAQNPRPENGRATVLVSAIGSESFQDENGNGRFDAGDSFDDISEAFRDDNRDGARDFGEPYIDFNGNGRFDGPDGLFGGPLCEDSARCSPSGGVSVRDSVELVMSGSRAVLSFAPVSGSPYVSKDTISVTVADINNNAMPSGTRIGIGSDVGTLLSSAEYVVGNCERSPVSLPVVIDLDDVDPPSGQGFLSVEVVSPAGVVSGATYRFSY